MLLYRRRPARCYCPSRCHCRRRSVCGMLHPLIHQDVAMVCRMAKRGVCALKTSDNIDSSPLDPCHGSAAAAATAAAHTCMRALLVLSHGVPVLGVPKHALHLQQEVVAWEDSSVLSGSALLP